MNQEFSIEAELSKIEQGDATAVGSLFERYRPRLREAVRLRLHDRLRSRVSESDILQEAYLDIAEQIHNYLQDPQVPLYIWMRGIALQRLQKILRHHLGAQRRTLARECSLPEKSSLILAQQLLADEAGPMADAMKLELRSRVQKAIRQLKADDQEVLLMREFEGFTNSEVAQALEISESAATMRYGRALVRLKDILSQSLQSGDSVP